MSDAPYAELKHKLDNIVSQLQSSETDIDEAMKLHEQGTLLIEKLQKLLSEKENKVKKITTTQSEK